MQGSPRQYSWHGYLFISLNAKAMMRQGSSRGNTRAAIHTQHCLLTQAGPAPQTKPNSISLCYQPTLLIKKWLGFTVIPLSLSGNCLSKWSKASDPLSDIIYSLGLETGICHWPSHKPVSWSRLLLDLLYLYFNCILYSTVNSDGHSES